MLSGNYDTTSEMKSGSGWVLVWRPTHPDPETSRGSHRDRSRPEDRLGDCLPRRTPCWQPRRSRVDAWPPASDRPVSFDAGPGRARIRFCAVASSRGSHVERDRVPAPTEGCQRHGCSPEQGASRSFGRARDARRARPRFGEPTLPGLPDCRTVLTGQRGGEPPGRAGPPGARSSAAGATPRRATELVRPTPARSTAFGTTAHVGLALAVRLGGELMRLSFDPEDPPEDPPAECVSPTVWRLSYRLHRCHQLAYAGCCACGDQFPCPARRLVERGFLAALGVNTEAGPSDLLDRLTQEET